MKPVREGQIREEAPSPGQEPRILEAGHAPARPAAGKRERQRIRGLGSQARYDILRRRVRDRRARDRRGPRRARAGGSTLARARRRSARGGDRLRDPGRSPLHGARPAARLAGANRRSRRVSVHARHPPEHVPRAPLHDAAVRRLGRPGGHERALPLPAGTGPDRASPSRSTCPRRWAWTPITSSRRARSARSEWRSTRWPTWSASSTGIPLDRVSTSFTINATAPILLAMYQVVGEKQGVAAAELRGTVQNDILKEFLARKTYIYPPAPSLRLVADVIEYAARDAAPLQPHLGLRLSPAPGGMRRRPGDRLHPRQRARRTSRRSSIAASTSTSSPAGSRFNISTMRDFFEEIAKHRAVAPASGRGSCASASAQPTRARGRCGCSRAADGTTLTSVEPLNNVVRTTLQTLAIVLSGAQAVHTMGWDEALALPDRGGSAARPPHTADRRPRERRHANRRPARRLVLRRGAHQRARGPRLDGCSRRSSENGVAREHRERLARARHRRGCLPPAGGGRERRSGRRRREPVRELERRRAGHRAPRRARGGPLPAARAACRDEGVPRRGAGPSSARRRDRRRGVRANTMPVILEAVRSYATVGEISEALAAVFGRHRASTVV